MPISSGAAPGLARRWPHAPPAAGRRRRGGVARLVRLGVAVRAHDEVVTGRHVEIEGRGRHVLRPREVGRRPSRHHLVSRFASRCAPPPSGAPAAAQCGGVRQDERNERRPRRRGLRLGRTARRSSCCAHAARRAPQPSRRSGSIGASSRTPSLQGQWNDRFREIRAASADRLLLAQLYFSLAPR